MEFKHSESHPIRTPKDKRVLLIMCCSDSDSPESLWNATRAEKTKVKKKQNDFVSLKNNAKSLTSQ